MQVMPAILVHSIRDFSQQINKLSDYFQYFQIDIADRIFVPNRTIQITDIVKSARQWNDKTNLSFDFHLMVKDYEKEIKRLEKLKNLTTIKNILIHYSVNPNFQFIISNFPFFSFGLVLDPQDKAKTIIQKYDLAKIPCIQIMSVNPGFQSSPFLKENLKKIEELRLLGYKGTILIDGAINNQTLPLILAKKYKPDILAVGSFLSKAKKLEDRVQYLKGVLS